MPARLLIAAGCAQYELCGRGDNTRVCVSDQATCTSYMYDKKIEIQAMPSDRFQYFLHIIFKFIKSLRYTMLFWDRYTYMKGFKHYQWLDYAYSTSWVLINSTT